MNFGSDDVVVCEKLFRCAGPCADGSFAGRFFDGLVRRVAERKQDALCAIRGAAGEFLQRLARRSGLRLSLGPWLQPADLAVVPAALERAQAELEAR